MQAQTDAPQAQADTPQAQSDTPQVQAEAPQTQTAAPQGQTAAPASPAEGPQPGADQNQPVQEVVVTGYRKSLQDSTDAKRAETGFADSIFAQDIGKFPDTNVAESFNRVPGIQIVRDATGEGINVAIRGLGPNFTRVLLNGAPVAVASTGPIDAQNSNREVDLNLFPTELFTRLDVKKSADAAMLEGGASGTLDMHQAHPFDHPGAHLTYQIQGTNNDLAGRFGERGSIIASDTWGDFGALIGYVGVHTPSRTTGFETIGWTNAHLTTTTTTTASGQMIGAQCNPMPGPCNALGGGNWSIPVVAPAGIPGLAQNTPIDQAELLKLNPGLSIQQINNELLPRLGRPMFEDGDRDRHNVGLGLEYKPTDFLHAYIDGLFGYEQNTLNREDMDWVVRSGAMIPENVQVDANNVVTSGTYPNSQFFLEFRPYQETTNFWGVNPGIDWQITDNWFADLRGNKTHSTFHREVPSVLAATAPGATVTYTNNGDVPTISSNVDLNDPANFMWNSAARVNIQDERRVTDTSGVRFNVTWGHGGPLNVSAGMAYDDVSRSIMALDNSQNWQNAVCGGNPNPSLQSPNTQPPCQGLTAAQLTPIPAGYPTYPGLGTPGGFTATTPSGSLIYTGSLIPQGAGSNGFQTFLSPSSHGFITLNWPAFMAASQYAAFHAAAPPTTSANTGVAGGTIEEKTLGAYLKLSGATSINDHALRYTLGVRWVQTKETVGAAVSEPNPTNTTLLDQYIAANPTTMGMPTTQAQAMTALDGAFFPNAVAINSFDQTYYNVLPSGELAYNVADNAVAKLAVSKTMTRPDPSALLPGVSFSNPSADIGTEGNPALHPYLSENVDLGFEYYMGGPSYWSLTAFRKRITGFTANNNISLPFNSPILAGAGINFSTLTPTQQSAIMARCPDIVTNPGNCSVVLTQQQNASGALTINGLELNYVQSMDQLMDHFGWNFLHGFGVSFNFTLIDQFGTGAAPAVALNVAPHSYNLTFFYETDAVSVRISTVYNAGSQTGTLNQNGIPLAALFSDDYQQWDFSSYVDLPKMFNLPWDHPLQLTFDVVNLTNASQRSFFQFSNATFTEYNAGRTYMFGIRGSF